MSLKGVFNVRQGWISSNGDNSEWSEAILLDYDEKLISLKELIEVHLSTHASTSSHSMRKKYRSAVYYFDEEQKRVVEKALEKFSSSFQETIITEALKFEKFKLNIENQLEYFKKNGKNQFCERYIHPKLDMLKSEFSNLVTSQNSN
jgi:peptide-methionine (S)-S-oxide reductase